MRDPIVLVCGADHGFAMPLAVAVRSVLDTLAPDRTLRLFVFDGGFTRRQRERLHASWSGGALDELRWLVPDVKRLRGVKLTRRISVASYFRLLAQDALPGDCERAIYLDADVFVRSDLTALWEQLLDPWYLLAAQDPGTPLVSSRKGLALYRELGIDPEAKYLNAGILVMNLAKWRADDVAGQVVRYLVENRKHVHWYDQDGLNAVLAGRWGELSRVWNHIQRTREVEVAGDEPGTVRRVPPRIVHFAGTEKPWCVDATRPWRAEYLEAIERTAWAGFRPSRPARPSWLRRRGFALRDLPGRAARALGVGMPERS